MGGGEGLAQDAGVVAVHGFVGHGSQTVVTLVVPGHSHLVAEFLRLGSVGDQGDLALVHNGVKLVHDHEVQDLGEVLYPQAGIEGGVGYTDPDLVALAGVHDTFHVVKPCVDLPLDNGLKVGLHLLAGHFDVGSQSQILGVGEVGADDGDLVILHLGQVAHHYQLGGGILAGPDLVVHVGLPDDFALESGGESHGDGQFLNLDLNVPQLQGLLHGVVVVAHGLQSAGNLVFAQVDVHHHREAQGDGAGTGGDHHGVNGAKGVHEGGNTVLGVVQQARQVAGLNVAEDQSGTDGNGDNVDDGGHVMAQGDDTELQAHLHTGLSALLDDIAHQEGHDALGLVVLNHLANLGGGVSLAENHGNAGNIAGDQGHAQGADDGIGDKAYTGFTGIGVAALYVLEALNDFRAHGGGKTGVQRLTQVLLIGNQRFKHAHAGGQVAQGLHLYAGSGVDGGEEIGSVGESDFLVRAVFGNGIVDRALSQAGNRVGTAVDQIG